MNRNGVQDVAIEEVGGVLSDHYDPRIKAVRLSSHNYREPSLAAIAVGAHEVGHVLQHAQGYVPLGIRSAMAPVAGFGSMLAFPLFMIGMLFFRGDTARWLMDLGILLFTGAVVFQLVTLPVEFDASKRALGELTTSGALAPQEVDGREEGAGRGGADIRCGGGDGGASTAAPRHAAQQPRLDAARRIEKPRRWHAPPTARPPRERLDPAGATDRVRLSPGPPCP